MRWGAPAASAACALLLLCLAAGVHFRGKAYRAELAARYDRWGIPIDEAVDNHPGDAARSIVPHAHRAGRLSSDKMMLKTVEALESKMDSLAAQVSRLGSTASVSSSRKPVEKEVVKVVHDSPPQSRAELSALKTIQTDIQNLITMDATKEQQANARSERGDAGRKQRAEARLEAREERRRERKERRQQELKDVEKRTMDAVKDAMARQRALDLQEAAAETERRRAQHQKQDKEIAQARRHPEQQSEEAPRQHAQKMRGARLGLDDKIALCDKSHPEDCKGSRGGAEHQPQAKSRWGRRDGETFDTYMGSSRHVDSSRAIGRQGDDEGAQRRQIRQPELATAVTASDSSLESTTGSVRHRVLELESREQYLEREERQSLDELPAISSDESRAESAVASDMQSLQIAKDRRVLAQRAVDDDTYNTGPLQTREDRQTLITSTKTEDDVRSKLRVDLHALAQAKLDAKRGPILAQSLHKVRADLEVAKDKLKVWDQVQEAKALERSKDFAARR